MIRDVLTVFHPSQKNGEVTKSQNHTISLPSWQGCAQFGFKSKRSALENFQKSHMFLPASEHCTMSVDVRLVSAANT